MHFVARIVATAAVAVLFTGLSAGAPQSGSEREILRSAVPPRTVMAGARPQRFSSAPASPAVVYVDDDYSVSGAGGHTWLVDAFNSIQDGIDAVAAGGTVDVFPGIYSETASGRFLFDASGPYQFGLFLGAGKDGVTVRGVDGGGAPITDFTGVAADVTTNATNSFGYSGVFVEADDVTITGLRILPNAAGDSKTIEVIGNNFTVMHCHLSIPPAGGSIYVNDWRFDTGADTSHVKTYRIESNWLDNGTSVDLASGAGYSGSPGGRFIKNNTFTPPVGSFRAAVSFSGSGTGVPWLVYSVGGAVIQGNEFSGGTQYIRARGTYDNSQFDWTSYWNDNAFDKAVVVGPAPPGVLTEYSYTSAPYTFNHVRHIGTDIQTEITQGLTGDIVLVAEGIYAGDITVDKRLAIVGAGSGADPAANTILHKGVSGPVVTLAASGSSDAQPVLLKDLRIEPVHCYGVNVASGAVAYVKLDNVRIIGTNETNDTENEVGLKVATSASLSHLVVVNSAFDHLTYGWYLAKHGDWGPGGSTVANVTVTNTSFSSNDAKGIYAEKLSEALFTGCTVDNNGLNTAFFNSASNGGVDINLKGQEIYQNLSFAGCTFTNNGLGVREGAGLMVKARGSGTDAGGGGLYQLHPATVTTVTVTGGTFTGNERGIRFGEPGQFNLGPTGVSVHGATIENNFKTYGGSDGSFYGGVVNWTQTVTDATSNYWGTIDGPKDTIGTLEVPRSPKPSVASTLNAAPSGNLGNAVSDSVDYFPWIVSIGGSVTRYAGYAFNDLNGNGAWDQPGEPPLNGWVIDLASDTVTYSATTGSGLWPAGYYEFVSIPSGIYTVSESSQPGWLVTASPASPVVLFSGEVSDGNNFGNFSTAVVQGRKFLDADGDSTKDAGEPGLEGWQIVATRVGGGGTKTQLTDVNGDYAFSFSPSETGVWQIAETPRAGWIQTVPSSPAVYMDTIRSGSLFTASNFGNFVAAVISGLKFNDFNRDSAKGAGEATIPGWLIRLKRGGLQVDSQYTDAGGNYLFDSLPAGSYEVSEESRPGWSRTVPAAPGVYPLTVASSSYTAPGRNFGNFHISPTGGSGDISGTKFEDRNANGVRDSADAGLAGWKIYLSIGAIVVDSAVTDTAGHFAFSLLDDGTYTVSEGSQLSWIRSMPADPGTYDLSVGDPQRIYAGIDFGNYRRVGLSGIVYRDVNHNGAKNFTEPGLAGLVLDVAGPEGPVQTQSQAGGAWSLQSLRPGAYTITEQVQAGSYLTQPASGSYVLSLSSGDIVGSLHFGNSVLRDTFDFRSFSYDSLALSRDERGKPGKPVKRKANKVEFCNTYVNTSGLAIDGLGLIFHSPIYIGDSNYPLIVQPVPAQTVVHNGGYKVKFTFQPPIQPGDTVELCAWGKGGRQEQHSIATWLSNGQQVTTADLHLSGASYLNQPRPAMPNPLNAAQSAFAAGGFGPQGLVVGIPRSDAPRMFGWVRMKRLSDLQRSLGQRNIFHTTTGKGLDFFSSGQLLVREQRKLSPVRHNNRLFGDLAALKVNIVASALGITPPGFGQLIYDDEIAPLSGLMVEEIAAAADTALTYWGGRTPEEYIRLDSVIRRINAAFEGPMDTMSFGTSLVYIGYGKLRDIAYMRANAGVAPKRLQPSTQTEAEAPEAYALRQNYPNPFNPATTIAFDLPEAGAVTLTVYDLLGREVATIFDHEEFEEGEYEWEFDASVLPSGIYFYRLQAGSFDRSMKMMLVK